MDEKKWCAKLKKPVSMKEDDEEDVDDVPMQFDGSSEYSDEVWNENDLTGLS